MKCCLFKFFFFFVVLYVRDDRYREFHCMPVGHPFSRVKPLQICIAPTCFGD